MADKNIKDLTQVTDINTTDSLEIDTGGVSQYINKENLTGSLGVGLSLELQTDLLNASSYIAPYPANGMRVSVWNDTSGNNGIYILIDNTDVTNIANWLQVGGGGGTYTGTAEINVGGISISDVFTSADMQTMWDALIRMEMFPSLTNPSSTFTLTQSGIHESGELITTLNFNSIFNRGTISPPYGTSGLRSGLPNEYNYTGSGLLTHSSIVMSDANNVANYTVLTGVQSWTNSVDYDLGEQPLSSYGNPFNTPLPAGTTATDTVSINGIFPFYWGVVDESTDIFDGITQAQILAITGMGKYVQTQGTKIVTTNPTNERFCIMYPATSPALTSVIDNSGFETISDYDIYLYNVVGLDTTSQSYRVYILKNDTTQTNFTNTYYF